MYTIQDLFDLSHTRAAAYLAAFTYPWEALAGIGELIRRLGPALGEDFQERAPEVWVHKTAMVAPTAYLGAPCIIGAGTEVRHGAFIRGSALVGDNCVVGNSVELKNVILFDNVQTPHYNYVGDSILGYKSHMGAGSITSNVKSDKTLVAVRCGAESVHLYCLEAYDDMPMGEEDRSECERDGITVHAGWGQTEIVVEDGKCAGIRFRKCTRVKNDEGRFAPEFDDSVSEQAECTTVLYCIGQKVDWRELLTGTAVEFNPNGTVKADPVTYQTAEKDIFVGGDAYTGQKFAIDAIAAGKEGAISLHRFVQRATLTVGRNRRQFIELNKESALIPVNYDTTPRQRIGYNEALRRTFSDERVAFTEEQIKKETARCLSCGASIVDPNKCIGCGVCTTKCAFDAIHLHRERPECSKMYACEDKMKAILPYMIKREFKIKRAARKSK